MKAEEIFAKTMPFVWAKLLLGVATALLSAVLFGILMGLSMLFENEIVMLIMLLLWLGGTGLIRFILMNYFGYMLKAGHIAVITEAVVTGRVPNDQIAYGKQVVIQRFVTANAFFAVDKLVAGAVKQVQKGIGRLGNALAFIPGMNVITNLAQYFVDLSLGYVDECCLGYTFYRRDEGAFKSAADGVVIYAQNWKTLLGNAAKTMALVMLGLIAITLVLFLALGLVFRMFNWPGWAAFVIAALLALAVKAAFIDSYILTRTMVSYMQVAPYTAITFDLYGNLCNISSKFKELFNKGQQEAPAPQPAYAVGGYAQHAPSGQPEKPAFCGQCGAKNNRGTKFCGSCGAPMA